MEDLYTVKLVYNPYTVDTKVYFDGNPVNEDQQRLSYISKKRLQKWIEPYSSEWGGIFSELKDITGEGSVRIEFVGTVNDFNDLEYAKNKYGGCFKNVELVHVNADADNSPQVKLERIKELYEELQNSPYEEFKTDDIKKAFSTAMNSEFRIVVVAPMSSGKSTLLNSLLGRDILPAVNQATTAVITEIKDNDELDGFVVSAEDKYGNLIADREPATKERISELNYLKDPNDPEGKEALIHMMKIEGPIPGLSSQHIQTVFVDTPGGNNSQNEEHELMMDEQINDVNKCMILYVFNGTQLSTNDSNRIIDKISNAMKIGDSKQSRDRFIFVANRMDDFDIAHEPYQTCIDNTILPMLNNNGISEPNLFLVSAITAKLIRMKKSGDTFTRKEVREMESLVEDFNYPDASLVPYASLPSSIRDAMYEKGQELIEQAQNASDPGDQDRLSEEAAEINSGIPAVEAAIKDYVDKYAYCIKIQTAHDAFMKKVNEAKMENDAKENLVNSEEKFNQTREELVAKQEKCNKGTQEKFKKLVTKCRAIKLDRRECEKYQDELIKKMNSIVDKQKENVLEEQAEYFVCRAFDSLKDVCSKAETEFDRLINESINKACEQILKEYNDYINDLKEDGMFSIGDFNLTQTSRFDEFNMECPDDLIKAYTDEERYVTGTHQEKAKGFFNWCRRVVGKGGWDTVNDYGTRQVVDVKHLIADNVNEIRFEMSEKIDEAFAQTEQEVENIKKVTEKKLDRLDNMLKTWMAEVEKLLSDMDNLREEVERNKAKYEWITGFVKKVSTLLEIEE